MLRLFGIRPNRLLIALAGVGALVAGLVVHGPGLMAIGGLPIAGGSRAAQRPRFTSRTIGGALAATSPGENVRPVAAGPAGHISRRACRIRRCADRRIRKGSGLWLSSTGGAPRGAD